MAGEGNLSRDFNLVNFNEALSAREENYVVELTPRESNATLSKLILTVDKTNYAVIQTDVVDELGEYYTDSLSEHQNECVSPGLLLPVHHPPGTEIIKSQGGASSPGSGKGTSK